MTIESSSAAEKPVLSRGSRFLIALALIALTLGGLFVVFVITVGGLSLSGDGVYNSKWDGSVSQVEEYLEATLNDADSYDPIEWSPISTHERPRGDGAVCVVRHKYRAKNLYGAYQLYNQLFWMDATGNVVDVSDHKQ